MKSFTKLFLSFTLIVLCFLGLTSSNSNTTFIDYEQDTKTVFSKETDGPLRISIYTHQDLETPSKTNKIYKWIKDTFGVTFKWDILGEKNEPQMLAQYMANNNFPDILHCKSTKILKDTNCLKDLKPLLEKHCPNLMKHYASVWNQMLFADSELATMTTIKKEHIYTLPTFGVMDGPDGGTYYNQSAFWIQKAVLKEFNYPKITTIDEYFELLGKYYKKHPNINGKATIPFSILCYDWESFNLWNPGYFLTGSPNDGSAKVIYKNNKYIAESIYTNDDFKKWLKTLNKYNKQGLVSPEIFTDTRDDFFKKMNQGILLGMFCQGWEFFFDMENFKDKGMYERTYCPLPLVFDKSIKPAYRDSFIPFPSEEGISISKNCSDEKAIKILKFLDEMIKEENQKILYWGFEGEDYKLDSKKNPYRTQDQINKQKDPLWKNENQATLWINMAPQLDGKRKSGYLQRIDDFPSVYRKTVEKIDNQLFDAYKVDSYAEMMDKNPPQNPFWYPLWRYNPNPDTDEGYELIQSRFAVEDYAVQNIPSLVTCKTSEFESKWESYSTEQKKLEKDFYVYMQKQLDILVKRYGNK